MVLCVDYDKRIVFVTTEHLNKRPKWMFDKGIINFYTLSFQNLISDVRSKFIPFKRRGFSMILKDENKNLILCFNELSE